MKILMYFEQPAFDNFAYVVVAGVVNDIACYRGKRGETPEFIAFHGQKLTKRRFAETMGAWDYEADGYHYRA